MKMIAVNTIKAGGAHVAPGGEFEVSTEEAKLLIASGAAREKGKADEDETVMIPIAANTAVRGPASGLTVALAAGAVADTAAAAAREDAKRTK